MKKRRQKINQFIEYLSFNKKRIILNYVFFMSIVFVALVVDLITKHFLFEWNGNEGLNQIDGKAKYQNWLFGIRSISNSGLTFLGNWLPIWLVSTLNIAMLLLVLFFMLILRSKIFAISLGMLFAGTLGNMIDRMSFGVVRDIIFLPWMDRGTFNLADLFAMIGSIIMLIALIVQIFIGNKPIKIKTKKINKSKIEKQKFNKTSSNNDNNPLLFLL